MQVDFGLNTYARLSSIRNSDFQAVSSRQSTKNRPSIATQMTPYESGQILSHLRLRSAVSVCWCGEELL